MYLKRTIPYMSTGEVMRAEKRIDAYIERCPLTLQIQCVPSLFNVFLKQIPKNQQIRYIREGIPYGKDGIYTLVLNDRDKKNDKTKAL